MELSNTELENLYRSNTNNVVCKLLGVTHPTLLKYLKENGIEIKGTRKKKLLITKEEKQESITRTTQRVFHLS